MPSDWSVISRVIPLTQPKWRCLTLVTLELLKCSWKRLLQHLLPQFSFLHPFLTLTSQTTSKMFCGETGTRDREQRWMQWFYSYLVILPLSCRLPLGSQGSFLLDNFFFGTIKIVHILICLRILLYGIIRSIRPIGPLDGLMGGRFILVFFSVLFLTGAKVAYISIIVFKLSLSQDKGYRQI